MSPIGFPELLPEAEYDEGVVVRKVMTDGGISLFGRVLRIGRGVAGSRVGLVPDGRDGLWKVYRCHQQIWLLDLSDVDAWLDAKDGRCRL